MTAEPLSVARLIERAETLVGASPDPGLFCRALVTETARHLPQGRVWLWRVVGNEEPACLARAGQGEGDIGVGGESILAVPVGQVVAGAEGESSSASAVLCAAELVGDARIVLEIHSESDRLSRATVFELADVFAELDRRSLLSSTLDRSVRFGDVMRFVSRLHENLDRQRVFHVFSTDGAALLGVDRIFIGRRHGKKNWSVEAATAVDRVNPRADEVRQVAADFREIALRRVDATSGEAAAVEAKSSDASAGDASAGDASAGDAGTGNAGTGNARAGESESPTVVLRPVAPDREWAGAVYGVRVESESEFDEQTLDLLIHHLHTAIGNCRRANEATFWGRVKRFPQAMLRPTSIFTLGVLLAIAGWLWFGTAELKIPAYGRAVPEERQTVYAPESGVIMAVHFRDEGPATEGEPLLVLRNEELALEEERIVGQIATSQARLAALATFRGGNDRSTAASVSAEQAELRIKLESLDKQLEIVRKRIDDLTITAGMSGEVFTDEPATEWLGRPVRRGDPIVDIANRNAEWKLELRVPERDVRHVIEAMNAGESRPVISYVLETSADVRRETSLANLEMATQVDEFGELSTLATALVIDDGSSERLSIQGQPDGEEQLDPIAQLKNRRPGAGVIASIHCGQRRAGFVYLRRAIEFFERQVWPW